MALLEPSYPADPTRERGANARAALSLANDLQHHRTADYREAALCAEATISVVNIAAIISGRRDRLEASNR